MNEREGRWGERRLDGAALAIYVALSLALCWPLPARLGADAAGRYVDTRVFQWNNWWVGRALFSGRDLDYSDAIFYPSGASLVSHNVNWVSSLLSVPLGLLLGPLVSYNLLFLFTFWGAAFAAYLLALDRTGHRGAAFVAGLVFGFAPYHVSGNFDGQMNLANVQWLPLFALFFLRALQGGRRRDGALAGVFYALAALDCWFFALFCAGWAVVAALDAMVGRLETGVRERVGRVLKVCALSAAVALILTAPFSIPVLRELGGGGSSAVAYHAESKSTDLLAFVLPGSDHPLFRPLVEPVYARLPHWRPAYLGIAALLLSIYAAFRCRRRALPWWVSGLCFAALALGSTLTINGRPFPNLPTPYALLTRLLPAIRIVRQASRFNVMVALSLSVLVALALADGIARLGRKGGARGARLLVGGASLLVLFEVWAYPCPLSTGEVSPFYRELAESEEEVALLELPIDDFHSREYLYPQTIHGKPLVNGYVARTPPGAQGFIYQHPLIRAAAIQMAVDPALVDVEREIGLLAANGIRYVVVHKRALPPQPPVDEGVLEGWRALYGPETVYEDGEIAVFDTGPAPMFVEAEGVVEGRLSLAELQARRVWLGGEDDQALSVELIWSAPASLDRDLAVRVTLLGEEGAPVAAAAGEAISPRYPTSRWPEGVVVGDRVLLPVDAAMPGGSMLLVVEVLDGQAGAPLGRVERAIEVAPEAAPFRPALEGIEARAGVSYGGEVRLLGVTARQEGEALVLDLAWLALRAMDRRFKVFVHLLDKEGVIAAQHDAMPRDWSYPTTLWGRGEVYVDRVSLDASGAPPGAYRLAVGVYAPGEDRLPAVDAAGALLADGRAVLALEIEVTGP